MESARAQEGAQIVVLHLIYTCIKHGGPWPAAAQPFLVTLLPKARKASPLNMRPISVTPLLDRLWDAAGWKGLGVQSKDLGA